MRVVFGILSLVVALAVVGSLAKQQMRAAGLTARPAAVASPPVPPVMPKQVADEVGKLMQQSTHRIDKAEP